MKHKYIISIAIVFFISISFSVKEVHAINQLESSNNYSINLINDSEDNVGEEVCTSLLGENLTKDLESIMGIIRFVGPLLVIFLSSMEYIAAITSKDDDAIKKCTNKLFSRLVLIVILFLLPSLLNLLLSILDQKYTTCIR